MRVTHRLMLKAVEISAHCDRADISLETPGDEKIGYQVTMEDWQRTVAP